MPGCCHEIPGRRLPEGSARRPPGCGFGGVGEGDAKRKQKKRKKKKKSRGAMPGCCHEIPGRRLPEGSARRPPGCGFGGVGEGDAKRKKKNKKKAGVPSHPVERLVPTYTHKFASADDEGGGGGDDDAKRAGEWRSVPGAPCVAPGHRLCNRAARIYMFTAQVAGNGAGCMGLLPHTAETQPSKTWPLLQKPCP